MTDSTIDPAVIDNLRQLNQEGEPDLVREVLTLFLSDALVRIAAIAEGIDRGDSSALQRAAHTFKGAAASVGATRLQAHCRDLELLGKSGTIQGAAALLERVRAEFERVEAEARRVLGG